MSVSYQHCKSKESVPIQTAGQMVILYAVQNKARRGERGDVSPPMCAVSTHSIQWIDIPRQQEMIDFHDVDFKHRN